MSTGPSAASSRAQVLADGALRARLVRWIQGRVPPSEVEDIVQATLTEALAAEDAPADPAQLTRWVAGVARHKCVDFYRRRGRELPSEELTLGEVEGEGQPTSARDLLRWAEQELPPGEPAEQTFEWLLREAEGDKLEHIADEEQVPAPRVRQRVTRMRRHFRERWAAQVAALVATIAAAVVVIALGRYFWRAAPEQPPITKELRRPELERAVELRREAVERCDAGEWRPCLERLDEAARLDPAGDVGAVIEGTRARARDGLERQPVPAPPSPPDPSLLDPSPKSAPAPSAPVQQKSLDDPRRGAKPAPTVRAPAPALTQARGKGEDGSIGNAPTSPQAPTKAGKANTFDSKEFSDVQGK